jgi:hypothetical protein
MVAIILATSSSWSPSIYYFLFMVTITIAISWSWSPSLLLFLGCNCDHCYCFMVVVVWCHQLLIRYLCHHCCLFSGRVHLVPSLLLLLLLRQSTSPYPILCRCGVSDVEHEVALASTTFAQVSFWSMLIFFLFFLFFVFLFGS